MPRKRQETNRTKIARMLIEEYKPNTAKDIQDAIKDLLWDTLEKVSARSENLKLLGENRQKARECLNSRRGYLRVSGSLYYQQSWQINISYLKEMIIYKERLHLNYWTAV